MQNINNNPLSTKPVGKLLKTYAIPSIVSMLVGALYNIVDQFYIGQKIGELGNAATNVAFPLSTSCVAIALLMGIGGATAFNLSLGAGDREKAGFFVGNALTVLFAAGTVLGLAVILFLDPLLIFFGSPQQVLPYARPYTEIIAWGFPFLIFSVGGGHLIRADGSPRYAMLVNLSGAILNTILDPLFIFVFDMDMAGAALATVLGQMLSFALALRYFTRMRTLPLQRHHLRPAKRYIGRIISLGTAPSFNQLAMMIVQIVMNNSLVHYGAMSEYGSSIPLACSGIVNKVAAIFFSVIIGISQGMQPIVSFNYGAGRYDRVRQVYLLAIRWGFAISATAFLLFQLIPKPIISLFGSGSDKYFEFAEAYFRIYMLFTFLNFLQPISSNLFTSIGKPKRGIFLSLTRQIIFLLPLILVFPMLMGIDGIMYAGPVADLAAASVSAVMVLREFRRMGRERIPGAVAAG